VRAEEFSGIRSRDNIRVNVICPFAESDGVKLWKQFAPDASR
jgi:hypothetical protein